MLQLRRLYGRNSPTGIRESGRPKCQRAPFWIRSRPGQQRK